VTLAAVTVFSIVFYGDENFNQVSVNLHHIAQEEEGESSFLKAMDTHIGTT
jgi:hypothetical protein